MLPPPYKNIICHSEGEARKNPDNKKTAGLLRSLSFAHNDGFTLAEVLITLVIIGVIAAITVPTLITKYQKEQTVTRLKKAYSALAQTTQRAIADNGPIKTWNIGETGYAYDTKVFITQYITPYMNLMKVPTSLEEGNWDKYYTQLNNEKTYYGNNYVRFYTSDGTSFTNRIHNNSVYGMTLYVYIDINGDKKPNKMGKDIFLFLYYIQNGKMMPAGYDNTRQTLLTSGTYNCHKSGVGETCSSVIMKDGWQIKDDYPW